MNQQRRETVKQRHKQKLLDEAQSNQRDLVENLNVAMERGVTYARNAMVFGGALYVGYTILTRYLDARLATPEKKREEDGFDALNKILLPLLAFALQQGSLVLMKKARMMLIDYLEEREHDKEK